MAPKKKDAGDSDGEADSESGGSDEEDELTTEEYG